MKPYIITEETTFTQVADMIQRAYDQGFEDGYSKGKSENAHIVQPITTPICPEITTPNPGYPPNVIYCNNASDC